MQSILFPKVPRIWLSLTDSTTTEAQSEPSESHPGFTETTSPTGHSPPRLFTAVRHPLFLSPLLKNKTKQQQQQTILSLHCLQNTVQVSQALRDLLLTDALAVLPAQFCCLLHSDHRDFSPCWAHSPLLDASELSFSLCKMSFSHSMNPGVCLPAVISQGSYARPVAR